MDGQCTHMPMIPTAWLSSGNFSSRHPCDDICDLYPYRLVGDERRQFPKMTVDIMQGKLPWLYRGGGSSDFSGIPKHMGER